MEHYREPKAKQPLSNESPMLHEHVQTVVYTGGDWIFSPKDGPAVILTHLNEDDFSHIETTMDETAVVVARERGQNWIRFKSGALTQFEIRLADHSVLNVDQLDEHIVLRN